MKSGSYKMILPALFLIIACSPKQEENGITSKKDSAVSSIAADTALIASKIYLQDCKRLLGEAKKMDSTLLKEIEVKPDVANKAIKAFTEFAYYCASDSLCPIYLIKTAQVAQSINNPQQAKIALDKCITDYTTSKHRAAALFLLAQLYDEANYLNNETEAKRLYEKLIAEYPKSDWAKSAKGALNFIGKSDAQIMEELKKKK